MGKEKRQSERWEVAIPCEVKWAGGTAHGRIRNISLTGAFITELKTLPPPERAVIEVNFRMEKEEVKIIASVTSRVVRNLSEILEDEIVGSIGVKFEDHSRKAQSHLKSVLRLISES